MPMDSANLIPSMEVQTNILISKKANDMLKQENE